MVTFLEGNGFLFNFLPTLVFLFIWLVLFAILEKTNFLSKNNTLNLFISALILFFVFEGLEKILKIKLVNLFYIAAILRIFIDINTIFSLSFVFYFVFQLIIFLIFVYFFIFIAYFKFGVHVKISDLQPGMNLCEKIIKRNEKYTVMPDIKISLFMFLRDKVKKKTVIDTKPEGLTEKEIKKIQTWNKSGRMEVGALLIQKRIPYAPFQFLGVIFLLLINIVQI